MTPLEFVVWERPLSLQARPRNRLQAWKGRVRREAARWWPAIAGPGARPLKYAELRLTIVFFCKEAPIDVDNIIKPIQDALTGLVYADDEVVFDVDSHRYFIGDPFDLVGIPAQLRLAYLDGRECVYVRVQTTTLLPTQL